jgi:hypothetical protein
MVISIKVVEERKRAYNEKRFLKDSQYLTVVQFCVFDDVIPCSPEKRPARARPVLPIKSTTVLTSTIPPLSLDLTSTLSTLLTIAKELEETAPKLSVTLPVTAPTTTRSGRTIKRRSGG